VAVGLYAALFQSGFGPMTLAFNVLIHFFIPILFSRAGDGSDVSQINDARNLNVRLIGFFLVLSFAAFSVTAAFHRPLFSLFVAPQFRSVSGLFPVLVLSGGLFSCGQLASIQILSGTTSNQLILPNIGSAVTGTLLTIVAAAYWGLVGVVIASLVSSIIYLVWVLRVAPGTASELLFNGR
jgi:O-antigen/teichoic acid export membrane protein